MTEFVVLDTVVDKICDRAKVENSVLQSVTVRCSNRSATFFIAPDLAGIIPIYYLNYFGVPEHISMPRNATENVKLLSSSECRKMHDCCIFRDNDLEVFL